MWRTKRYDATTRSTSYIFIIFSTPKTGEEQEKQVFTKNKYLLIRLTLNRLEKRSAIERAFSLSHSLCFSIFFNHGRPTISQSPGTNYSNFNVRLKKNNVLTVLQWISPVVTDDETYRVSTCHIKILAVVYQLFFYFCCFYLRIADYTSAL